MELEFVFNGEYSEQIEEAEIKKIIINERNLYSLVILTESEMVRDSLIMIINFE